MPKLGLDISAKIKMAARDANRSPDIQLDNSHITDNKIIMTVSYSENAYIRLKFNTVY